MEALIRNYWPAVYAYLRRQAIRPEEAGETTQAFFVNVVLTRELFESAEQGRGRLRTLMCTALQRYLVDQRRRESVRQRGAGWALVESMTGDEEGRRREEELLRGGAPGPAEAAFERRWALAQVEEALRRCREHFEGMGKERHWRAFEARVLRPVASMTAPPPLAELAGELRFGTAAEVAAAVQVVKKRLLMLLHGVVAETVEAGEDVETEVRGIARALGQG